MTSVDLQPAARRMADLIANVPDDRLDGPTPCPDYTLRDLVEHVDGLSLAFAAAAAKDVGQLTEGAPAGDGQRLADGWRTRIPQQLAAMAAAWQDPDAWQGMTRAGGIDLPGEVAGVVALDELVIHGWDVARASGQDYDCDPAALEAIHGFVAEVAAAGEEGRQGLFGPPVDVDDSAPLLDRVIGLTGRDPAWSPA
ncbi:MAG: hypothetical protein QOH36_1558 [Actinomycetota bacterium]|nr:hypothetical protein [Actinomycetota bacterium]